MAGARVFALPLRVRFRGTTVREGVLLPGPRGWGEFSPFAEYDDATCVPWLAAAAETALLGWPAPVRDRVAVNAIVPAVAPGVAADLVAVSGCRTVKVKVAEPSGTAAEDLARLSAVREVLGPGGAVRIDANAAWDVDTALARLPGLDRAAGGLQYVEQPCPTLGELARVRALTHVPIAADESIRRAEDPLKVSVAGAADLAVIKGQPLGGVRRALAVADAVAAASGLRCVVSSALESSIGLAAQIALAGALPGLDLACGLGTGRLFAADLLPVSLVPTDGWLAVPLSPPVPDQDLLEAARPADPARERWWLERLGRVASLLEAASPDVRSPRIRTLDRGHRPGGGHV